MKSKQITTHLIVLFVLLLSVFGGYVIGKAFPQSQNPNFRFSTSYQNYADPQPVSAVDFNSVIEIAGKFTAFDVNITSEKIAIATSKNIQVYDLNTLEMIQTLPIQADIYQIQFSPDSKKLAISASEFVTENNRILHILVYGTSSWDSIYETKSGGSEWLEPSALAWNPDSNRLALVLPERVLSVMSLHGHLMESES